MSTPSFGFATTGDEVIAKFKDRAMGLTGELGLQFCQARLSLIINGVQSSSLVFPRRASEALRHSPSLEAVSRPSSSLAAPKRALAQL